MYTEIELSILECDCKACLCLFPAITCYLSGKMYFSSKKFNKKKFIDGRLLSATVPTVHIKPFANGNIILGTLVFGQKYE